MPPSNTSSPLSDAASLPNNEEDNDDDLNLNEAGPSRLVFTSGGRQYTRSDTSSTVQLGLKDDDSDLSDLSDEDDEVEGEQEDLGNDSDGNEEIGSVRKFVRKNCIKILWLPTLGNWYKHRATPTNDVVLLL